MPVKRSRSLLVHSSLFCSPLLIQFQLRLPKDIKSLDDLNWWLNLHKYSELCNSGTIKELQSCLNRCPPAPNTSHLLVVLQLCDIRVQSFWQRLENSFNLLAKNRLNGESIQYLKIRWLHYYGWHWVFSLLMILYWITAIK